MTDKKNKSNKSLEDKFQDVFDNHFDELPYYKDMKFDTKIDYKDLVDRIQEKKTKKKFRKLKVASFLLAILICSSAFTIVITSGSAEAGRDNIVNFFNNITGNEHKITDKPYRLEILDINDKFNIKKAKDIIPNLVIEKELFDGYIFDHMIINKQHKNYVVSFSYYYKINEDEPLIMTQFIFNKNSPISIDVSDKEIKINNGTLYINEIVDDDYNLKSIAYVKDYEKVEIISVVSMEEMESYMREKVIPLF